MTQYPFTTAKISFVPAGVREPTATYHGDTGEATRNYEPEMREVQIVNGRLQQDRYTLDQNGFELVHQPTQLGPVTEDADPTIKSVYYPEVTEILKQTTGAREVLIFDHTIRITGNANGRHPVQSAHNDYTETSAPKRVKDLLGAQEAQRWLSTRVAQVNLWRPLVGPVTALPLALLDAQTLGPVDLRPSALIFKDRTGQIYHVSHSSGQRWTYFPNMSTQEAILIKGYDSDTSGRARFTPHTAFTDPSTPDGLDMRHSIEVRAFLRFD
jgi:hypothetical protein